MGRQLPVIQPQTFRCDPHELCEGAACCRTPETDPALSLADYFRLSRHTGLPMSRIWHDNGNAHIYFAEQNRFLFTLGLLHEPCPYLTGDLKCGVYEMRPRACAEFPYLMFNRRPEALEDYSSYRCLQNVSLSTEQAAYAEKLYELLVQEGQTEMQIFWGNMPAYFHVPHLGVFFEMAAKAFDITIGKDPNMTKSRTRQLVSNLRDMDNYAKDWIHEKRIDANFYKSALNHVVFSLVEDEIAQRFEGLKDTDLKPFEETTRRLIELNASLERTKCK